MDQRDSDFLSGVFVGTCAGIVAGVITVGLLATPPNDVCKAEFGEFSYFSVGEGRCVRLVRVED